MSFICGPYGVSVGQSTGHNYDLYDIFSVYRTVQTICLLCVGHIECLSDSPQGISMIYMTYPVSIGQSKQYVYYMWAILGVCWIVHRAYL